MNPLTTQSVEMKSDTHLTAGIDLWTANKDVLYAFDVFIWHIIDDRRFSRKKFFRYETRTDIFDCSETSLELCIPFRFDKPPAHCAFRGFIMTELMSHTFTRSCSAVENTDWYKLLVTQWNSELFSRYEAETVCLYFFHTVFIRFQLAKIIYIHPLFLWCS